MSNKEENITWLEFVQRYIPDIETHDDAMDVMWEFTGFPGFYHGDSPLAYFGGQLQKLADIRKPEESLREFLTRAHKLQEEEYDRILNKDKKEK